ncbi:MAG: septum formation initiator family protein [Candidatus Eisenbacteria bacterium]|uniref:Septum formation initiator family protein n=1 Tax=Eiseniibacteriota bacterium TaxID=2212470 RepID=A0A538UAX3_UNCEI|nr:MAG: septum formation initiator family protein [Candidatus Eisenbacteria bacterium]
MAAQDERPERTRTCATSASGSSVIWVWPLLGLWLVYVGALGEHSWFRIWRLSRESGRIQKELAATRTQLDRLEHQLKDPDARRQLGEKVLRERNGFAGQGELIYRIPAPDSLQD